MAWFNTDWNIANMFNLPTVGGSTNNPYGFTGGQAGGNMITPWNNTVTGETWDAPNTGYQPPNSNWQMTGGNKTNNLNSVWGAPAYYQASNNNMFNNPYQTQGGGFFNPYQFGQVDYPYQSGGNNTNQQPWWMNYNTNSSIVNPPNIPTTSVDPMDQGKYVGNPNHANDGWAGGTQKGHTAYKTAADAMEADDYWSAYRKDHQQWRDSQGIYASGGGKEDGQSDLHYPGNPTLGIRSDAHQLNAMGMGGMFESQLPTAEQQKLLSMFSSTPNAEGGNDYKVIGDGTVVLPSGLTVETQLTDPYKNNPNIFDNENELRASNDILSSGDLRRFFGTEQIYPLDNSNAIFKEEGTVPLGYQGGIATDANLFRMFNADQEKNQSLRKEQWDFQNPFGETDSWNLGRPGDSNYVKFEPTYNPNPITQSGQYNYFDSGNNIFTQTPKTAEDWAKEYETDRVYQHKPATNLDPFNQASNYNYQQASNPSLYDSFKDKASSLGSNIFDLIVPKAEGAVINDGNMLQNWVEQGPGMQGASQDEVASWMETGDAVQEYARKGNLMRNMLTDNYNSTPLGANVSAMIEANKIAAVKKEKDEEIFTPRVTRPAKEAEAKKKAKAKVKKTTTVAKGTGSSGPPGRNYSSQAAKKTETKNTTSSFPSGRYGKKGGW